MMGLLPQKHKLFFFFVPPIHLQHCISSRLLVFFPTKLLLISCFFYIFKGFFFYFSLTNHTMSTTSFCKTITIQKSDSFMITFHTWGNLGIFRRKLHTFSTSHSESRPNKLFKLNSQILTQLKNLNILVFIFLNTRWKVEDAIAVGSHNIRFN